MFFRVGLRPSLFSLSSFAGSRLDSTESRVRSLAELELEQIQTQMVQKPMLREEVHARALPAIQNVMRAELSARSDSGVISPGGEAKFPKAKHQRLI
jgi:hypothetical protein